MRESRTPYIKLLALCDYPKHFACYVAREYIGTEGRESELLALRLVVKSSERQERCGKYTKPLNNIGYGHLTPLWREIFPAMIGIEKKGDRAMVYVISKTGQPIMPTENHAKVRLLLKFKKAKVVRRIPFTIQLLDASKTYTQPIILGVDAGSKHVGLSATTKKKELFAAELRPRNDVVKLMSDRREVSTLR